MDNKQASQMFKPSNMTGFRDFPEGCGLHNTATTDTTLKQSVQQSSTTGHEYWKRRKFAIRSSPPKAIHIKKLNTESSSNEGDGDSGQCISDDVPREYFDLQEKSESSEHKSVLREHGDFDKWGKVRVESNDKYGTQYGSNVISRGKFDLHGKKKVESNGIVTSEKVKKALRLFRSVCRSLEEEKVKPDGIKCTRIDFRAAQILKDSLKHISIEKPIIGAIPGVEVNDQFLYRAELGIVGIHRPAQSGIDYLNQNGTILATSVVDSGGYANHVHDSDSLVYVGQGGRVTQKNKVPEHQVLKKGNLALKNSMEAGNPIRVLHKVENWNSRSRKDSEMYTYNGLYEVVKYWHELGDFDKRVYKFKLVRLPGQARLVARRNILG